MKAIVNQDTCIGCGLCISTVPEVFEVNADGKAEACGHTTDENRAAVQEASRETGRRKKRKEKREREAAKAQEERKIEEALAQGVNPEELDAIKVSQGVTVQELAEALDVPANDIIKRLFLLGTPLTMTQSMSDDLVELVADDLGRQIKIITPVPAAMPRV